MRLIQLAQQHRRALPCLCAALAFLVAAPSLWTGFCTDDHMLRLVHGEKEILPGLRPGPLDLWAFSGRTPADTARLMDLGFVPWWAGEHWRIAFWRPLSAVSHWLDWTLFGDAPWPMHAHNLVLYGALTAVVVLLYLRFTRAVAALGGVLFAIDAAHGMPAGWLSNRNAVLAVLFGMLALWAYDRWRRSRHALAWFGAVAALALSLLGGESGIAVGGYLAAYAFFIDRDGTLLRRFARLLPFAAVVLVWRIAYSSLGYGSDDTPLYVDPGSEPVQFALRTLWHLPILLFAQFGFGEVLAWNYFPPLMKGAAWAGAVAFCLLVLLAFRPLLAREPAARFWLAGAVLATVPACAALPQARLLLFTGVGALALIAMYLVEWREHKRLWPRWRHGIALFFVLFHVVISAVAMPIASCSMWFAEVALRREMGRLPEPPAIEEKTVVVLNATADVWCVMFLAMRLADGRPLPAYVRQLTAGVQNMTVTRTDDRTLEISPKQPLIGTAWSPVFRDAKKNPLRVGEVVTLPEFEVTILEVDARGEASRVKFAFAHSLNAPQLVLLQYQDGKCVPFTPPAPGETVTIRTPGLFEMIGAHLDS